MKIETKIDKIKKALIITERMTGKNLTLPVLNSILMVASDNNLILRSTNLSIGVQISIPVKVESTGTVAIKGDVISSMFANINTDTNVVFNQVDNNLNIKTKNNNIILKTLPHEDFPTLPTVIGEKCIIPVNKFIEGLKSVYFSASVSDIKPEIGSVYIYPQDDNLVFVATDSFRLAEKKVKIKQNLNFNGILIPFKNTIELIRVFEGESGDLEIVFNKNQASFTLDNIYITSRVVDGVFPDYKQIIPKQPTTEVVTLKQDIINALKVANVLSDKFNQIIFSIKPKDKKFEIESKNSDLGENITILSGALKGEDVTASFNYKYILDSFQSISTDSVTFELTGSNKAMVVRGVSDNTFLYLIMPMNR